MRKFLLGLGTLWVGMITVAVGFSIMISSSAPSGTGGGGGGAAFFGGIVLWLFALLIGLALSAPAFLNPPEDNGGFWVFRLPLPLWMFLMAFKLMSWIGFYILLGTWILIFKVWDNRTSNRMPAFSNAPSAAAPSPAAASSAGASYPAASYPGPWGMPAASWQTDPTHRYGYRWWDGTRWTDRVANGNVQAIDPI